jgi:glycosyltransferase involved in cell wall biosynthesis
MMGGAERTVDELYTRLGKLQYEIDFVTPNLGGKSFEKKGNFNIFRVGKKANNKFVKFLLYQWNQYKQIKKLIKHKEYDLIHVNYGFTSCFLALWLKRKLRVPLVVTEFHLGTGMDIIKPSDNPWYVRPILKSVYKSADAITAISNEQKRFVESISGRKDISVIYQGTDEIIFSPKKYSKEIKKKYGITGPFLLTVSRLNKRKNIIDQIISMKKIKEKFPTAKLIIVGKGEEESRLKSAVKEYNLQESVIFTGFVPEQELPKLYATADIFILTSKFEGFGIANCEALASGTPVITYDTSAAQDFIVNDVIGFIVKNHPDSLAEEVIHLLSDDKKLAKMSKNARKEVEAKYTWQIYTLKHKGVFDKVQNVSNK